MEPPAPPTVPTDEPSGPGSTSPPPHRPGSIHDLRRSRHDRMLGGVAAGIARTYGWDPTLVRLAFVVAAVFGIGIPIYVVAWIVIPPDPDDGTAPESRETGPLVGLVLLGVGVLWLGGRLVPNGDIAEVIWPLTLIAGGIAVLVMRSGSATAPLDGAPPPDTSVPSETDVASASDTAGTDAAATTAAGGVDRATDADSAAAAAAGATDTGTRTAAAAATTASAWAQPARWPDRPRPPHPRTPRTPKPPRPRSYLGLLTMSALALFVGTAALLATLDVVDVNVEVAGAIALGIVGGALVLSAWFGRARSLVPVAVLLTIALSVVAVVDTPLEGGIGDREYRPASLAQLDDDYRLGIGSMTLDLRDVPLRAGTTDVDASVAIGELHVLVPTDVTVEVHAESGIGRVAVFGVAEGGIAVERDDAARATGSRVLRLDLRTGIGETKVERTAIGVVPPSDSGGLR